MQPIPCFMLEPTDLCRVWLRRYASSPYPMPNPPPCPGPGGYHNGMTLVVPEGPERATMTLRAGAPDDYPTTDARWPTTCEACGYAFTDDDEHQVFALHLYRRADTGALHTLRDAPVGAIWNASWMAEHRHGPDGRCLVVKTPGGDWCIDDRANNCTRRDDNVHKCWVRHGEPPNLHVDKNGDTCAAGAGSIVIGNFHGFLHHGHIVGC